MSRITLTVALAMASIFAIGQSTMFPKAEKSVMAQRMEARKHVITNNDKINPVFVESFADSSTTNINGIPDGWSYTPSAGNVDEQWRWSSTTLLVGKYAAASGSEVTEELITPDITLPTTNPQLWFYFYSHNLIQTGYQGMVGPRFHIEISTDGGNTWEALFEMEDVNDLMAAGLSNSSDYQIPAYTWFQPRINLTGYEGETVKIKFIHLVESTADFNYWLRIDDVVVTEQPVVDLKSEGQYYVEMQGGSVYEYQPLADQRPFTGFMSNWVNLGSDNATNVVMHNELKDSNGDIVFTADTNAFDSGNSNLPSLARDTMIKHDASAFNVNALTEGTYTYWQYLTSSPADEDTLNNYFALDLTYNSGDAIARTIQRDYDVSVQTWVDGNSGSSLGIQYNNTVEHTLYSVDIEISDRTVADVSVQLVVYTVDWNTNPATYTYETSSDERTIISADIGQTLTLDLPSPYTLEANTDYFIGIKMNYGTDMDCYIKGHDYKNTGLNAYAAAIIFTDAQNNETEITTFGNIQVPYILMHLQPTGVEEVAANNNNLKVYPNPTNGTLHVDGVVEGSTVNVYNMVGTLVASIENASNTNVVDLSSLEEGSYIVKVITDNKVSVKKVTLVK